MDAFLIAIINKNILGVEYDEDAINYANIHYLKSKTADSVSDQEVIQLVGLTSSQYLLIIRSPKVLIGCIIMDSDLPIIKRVVIPTGITLRVYRGNIECMF